VQSELAITPAEHVADRRAHRRLQPSRGFLAVDVGELWRYRELLFFFLWRDAKARYKQTYLGPFWAIFRPLTTIVLFSIIFGRLVGVDTGSDIPYPLFALGLLPWTYFSSVLTGTASSLLNNAGILSKVYFPRMYAPISAACTPLLDFALMMLIAVGLFAYYQRVPSWQVVFVPVFIFFALLTGLGVGLWFSGISVRYRDVQFGLPFAISLWMYLTPVIYPTTIVPEKYQWIYDVNPMTAVVEGFRWSLFGEQFPGTVSVVASVLISITLVICGSFFFRRTERTIMDMV
jgi:lipopolysaccharide transport system permease protein